MDILVIGSMNMDLVVKSERYPGNGETITGTDFKQIPGGKGANQACAVGRLGGDVAFIGACGQDEYGNFLLTNLQDCGVNTDHTFRVDRSTGIAVISVDSKGDNRITIVPGANAMLTPELIDSKEEYIKEASIILLQLEIPLNTVLHTIKLAKRYDTKVILDPAPVQLLPNSIYSKIDFLLPNEVEIKGLLSSEIDSTDVKRLLEMGTPNVIITRGEAGVSLYNNSGYIDFPAERVKPVDSTAAGDAFAGGLAYSLNMGKSINDSIKYANIVAALAVTKLGAQSSLPDRDTVDNYIKSRH